MEIWSRVLFRSYISEKPIAGEARENDGTIDSVPSWKDETNLTAADFNKNSSVADTDVRMDTSQIR